MNVITSCIYEKCKMAAIFSWLTFGPNWCNPARRAIAPLAVPLWMNPSHSCYQDGRRKGCGRLCYDFPPCSSGSSPSGKRRPIRDGGFATRISSNVRPQDPHGGGGGVQHGSQPPGVSYCVDRGPPLSPRAVPQLVPVRVSVCCRRLLGRRPRPMLLMWSLLMLPL